MSDEETSTLGFQLYADAVDTMHAQGRTFNVIGHLHSPQEFLVGEHSDDGSVWLIPNDPSALLPLNASRSATEACLAAFERYIEDGPEDSGPMILTAEEMRERLERRARGESVPLKPPKPVLSHRKRMKRLRSDFKAADPTALTQSSWWSGTLEEAKNDLL